MAQCVCCLVGWNCALWTAIAVSRPIAPPEPVQVESPWAIAYANELSRRGWIIVVAVLSGIPLFWALVALLMVA